MGSIITSGSWLGSNEAAGFPWLLVAGEFLAVTLAALTVAFVAALWPLSLAFRAPYAAGFSARFLKRAL